MARWPGLCKRHPIWSLLLYAGDTVTPTYCPHLLTDSYFFSSPDTTSIAHVSSRFLFVVARTHRSLSCSLHSPSALSTATFNHVGCVRCTDTMTTGCITRSSWLESVCSLRASSSTTRLTPFSATCASQATQATTFRVEGYSNTSQVQTLPGKFWSGPVSPLLPIVGPALLLLPQLS